MFGLTVQIGRKIQNNDPLFGLYLIVERAERHRKHGEKEGVSGLLWHPLIVTDWKTFHSALLSI